MQHLTPVTVVCGTDFSAGSGSAVRAASEISRALGTQLHLVHAVDAEGASAERQDWLSRWARTQLESGSVELRQAGSDVVLHLKAGSPAEALREVTEEVGAGLVVVGTHGSGGDAWQTPALGTHVYRVIRRAQVPVLVVADDTPFRSWLRDATPLKVMLGMGVRGENGASAHWVHRLERLGALALSAVRLYWPPSEFHRLGVGGVQSYLSPPPEVAATLREELKAELVGHGVKTQAVLRPEPHMGRIADRLVRAAAEEGTQLLVIGSHPRGVLARMWEGSVSERVLRDARCSVLAVPSESVEPRQVAGIESVLVATDFSALGDSALALAYGVLTAGGTVHLVHVKTGDHTPTASTDALRPAAAGVAPAAIGEAEAALRARSLDVFGIRTEVHVVEAPSAAAGILAAAERLHVDAVCLGTHGHTGAKEALLGSVAAEVVRQSKRPVLLARPS